MCGVHIPRIPCWFLPDGGTLEASSQLAAGPKGMIPRCSQPVDSAGLALAV